MSQRGGETGAAGAGRHAELALLAPFAALGAWLASPTMGWALAAVGASALAALFAPRAARRGITLVAIIAVAATVVAVSTALRVRAAEQRWPAVREDLIRRASATLSRTLERSVAVARRLADQGAAVAAGTQADAFAALDAQIRADEPEAGVVVLDAEGRPWSWAGHHRLPVGRTGPADLSARMTAFYVVLEARRQPPGGPVAVGQVLLAADSAVPDRENTVAARFAGATGAHIEFFGPGRGPLESDVFDYCIPSCTPSPAVPRPDTLFSVRTSPPTQGAFKLTLLAAGARAVAWLVALGLGVLLVRGRRASRYAGLGLGAALLVLTPAGSQAGLGALFSPVPYYLELLDPLSASVGALIVTGGLLVTGLVAVWRLPGTPPVRAAAILAALLAPAGAWALARGITPPGTGARLSLWLAWQAGTMLVTAALVLVGAWGLAPWRARAGRWFAPAAVGLALLVGGLGLAVWRPGGAWPWWYPLAWVPVVLLAAAAGSPLRQLGAGTAVAGAMAAVFTWGAVVDGRLTLARADAHRLGDSHDAVTLAMLDRFADELAVGPPPRSAAALYRRWARTPLEHDGYPAVLNTWGPDGRMMARLALADVDLPVALLQAAARTAAARREPRVEEFARVPGIYAVLAAPTADGSVVTAGVGPRSRIIPRYPVTQFLQAPGPGAPLYELSLSEPTQDTAAEAFTWRRDGRLVRGEEHLDVPGGARHLHVTVDLGEPGALLVRGALLVVLDLLLVLLLWGAAEAVAGESGLRARVGRLLPLRSYRLRLTVALAVFFIVPTVGFAAWMGGRLRVSAERERDLVTRQALRDATGILAQDAGPLPDVLASISARAGTDLVWYAGGALADASSPLLPDVGLIDPYLPPGVYSALMLNDALELTADAQIAGRPIRVSYRAVGAGAGNGTRGGVLAAPRLAGDTALVGDADLAYALLLVTLLGLAAAAALARVAARSLARPVGVLRDAAGAVGRGEPPPPLLADVPEEFASVSEAFTRMAADVRASQSALEAARQRTVAVLRHVATGVLALSRDFTVSMANPRAEHLLGGSLPPGSAVRARTPAAWAPVWDWIAGVLARQADLDGREFPLAGRRILVQVSTLGAEAGGCVVALDDVTELAHAVRVLAWGELARQVAHEIKNPLTPLRLGVQHLQRAYRDARGAEDFEGVLDRTAGQILGEIDRLDAVARAFARFGTPGTEQQAGPLEPVDLVEVARETAALYTLGGDTRIVLTGETGVQAPARRGEVKEVLVNLLENARNARATDVTIGIADGGGSGARLTVHDNGAGIAAAVLPRVFEPHFSTTTSGTGLGLAICKRLVESWGGVIAVDSQEGRGTTVTVSFAA